MLGRWLIFIHVLSALTFFLGHGAGAAIIGSHFFPRAWGWGSHTIPTAPWLEDLHISQRCGFINLDTIVNNYNPNICLIISNQNRHLLRNIRRLIK